VGRCALIGAAAGPAGALAGGASCGIAKGPEITKNGALCAANAKNIYQNFGSRGQDVVQNCGQSRINCGGGGANDVPMSSFR
jgi:hypothetical protein